MVIGLFFVFLQIQIVKINNSKYEENHRTFRLFASHSCGGLR